MTTTEILFGNGLRRADCQALARAVGTSSATIYNWKKNPNKIPLEKLKIMIRAQNIPDEQVLKLMRARR